MYLEGIVGVPPSCALLGGFAIGAQVSLLLRHSLNAKFQRVLVLTLCLVYLIVETKGNKGQLHRSKVHKI